MSLEVGRAVKRRGKIGSVRGERPGLGVDRSLHSQRLGAAKNVGQGTVGHNSSNIVLNHRT